MKVLNCHKIKIKHFVEILLRSLEIIINYLKPPKIKLNCGGKNLLVKLDCY